MFIKVFFLTGIVRLAIISLPFRWLSPALGKHMQESPMNEKDLNLKAAREVGWVCEKVSRYTPWESKCLVQAIIAKIILRQLGIANTLYLGVSKDKQNGLVAHAWLRCGEIVITGGQSQERFTIVSKFADGREK